VLTIFPDAVAASLTADGYFKGRSLHRAVLLLLAVVFRDGVFAFQYPYALLLMLETLDAASPFATRELERRERMRAK
jgi:hypothetical protein